MRQKAKPLVGDLDLEVLGHLVTAQHGADGDADLVGPVQRSPLALDPLLDGGEIALGGIEQIVALARSCDGQVGIAADDEAFAGEVRRGDDRHVALVEQGELQFPVLGQSFDVRRAQRGDPVEIGRDHILADAGLGDHASVTDQHDVREAETNLQLVDLDREGFGVAGVAVEYLDRHRTAIRCTEQAVDDLKLALLAVAVIPRLANGQQRPST